MLHGLGVNRHNFDLFGDSEALPRQLARRGHPVYVVELRGVGLSRAPTRLANERRVRSEPRGAKTERRRPLLGIDAYLNHDLPAAVSFILKDANAQRLHWVGHSMGAMLGYIYGGAFPERLQSLFAAAGPVPAAVKLPGRGFLLPLRHAIAGRRMGDVEVPNRAGVKVMKRVPRLVRLAYDKVLFYSDNMPDELLLKMADGGLENIPLSVMHRLGEWVSKSGPYSGEIERSLGSLFVPTLLVAATYDPLCTPAVIERVRELMPHGYAQTQVVSRERGFANDYGHGDLLVSPNAKRDVYPLILDFVAQHERQRRSAL